MSGVAGDAQGDIDSRNQLLELAEARDDFTVRIYNERPSIEDEFVLSTDGVHVHDRRTGTRCSLGKQRCPFHQLVLVKWGGVDVDDDLRARVTLGDDRSVRKPRVLANARSNHPVRGLEESVSPAGPEVTMLVEDPVVGQFVLVINGPDFPGPAKSGCIVEGVPSAIDEAGDHNEIVGRSSDLLRGFKVRFDKGPLEQQVLRWVSGDGQLR